MRFWILLEQAFLSLDENRPEEFLRIYPNLLYDAKSDDQKRLVEELRKRSPIDPTKPREHGVATSLATTPIPPSVTDLKSLQTIVQPVRQTETSYDAKALTFLLETTPHLDAIQAGAADKLPVEQLVKMERTLEAVIKRIDRICAERDQQSGAE